MGIGIENLSEETIKQIYKDIHCSEQYMKHARLQREYLKQRKYASAAIEGKICRDMEIAVFSEFAKQYLDKTELTLDVVRSMTEEDRHQMNVYANALVMLSDVLDNLVTDTNSILKKYIDGKNTEFDNLKGVLSEVKGIVSYFDNKIADEKAAILFGQCSDKLYNLIVNGASSYVNKLKKYEEDSNKKSTRVSKVA